MLPPAFIPPAPRLERGLVMLSRFPELSQPKTVIPLYLPFVTLASIQMVLAVAMIQCRNDKILSILLGTRGREESDHFS